MRRKTIFYKMVIGALLLSILSGCGKKAGVDYIQENDSRQDAVSASDLHLNYSVSNGRTTVNVDADVNTSLSTQSAPVATAVRCDYTNEDITRIAAAIFDEGSYKLFLPYSRQSKENITAACDAFAETFATYADKSKIPYNLLAECSYAQNAKDGGVFDPIETNGTIQYYPTIKPSADSEEFCNFCNIRGTIDGKDCQLSFVQTRKHCMLVLHKDYNEELTDVFPTQTIQTVYDIDDTYQVSANYNKEPEISYDSYLVYGGRSLDALTPVYTTANFQPELTDYESMDQDENGTISNYEDYTFYGYESITANVGNDGLNYLIVSNPMKIETIDVDMANTLDFSQVDAIAQDYINKHTFDETVYDITDIRYGLIRVSNEEDDSYQLLPAWYYLAEGSEESKPYYFPSAYVIINAIDGSIYNNELGYIYQHRNKSD